MKIQIDPHTLERASERGASEAEIQDVICNGAHVSAKHGCIAKAKVYDFRQERHGKYYEQKRVEVIYIIELDTIVTVTVYVFYGKWGEKMQIIYNSKTDLLYIRLDDRRQAVINRRLSDDIVLDIGEQDRIVGIEILDASERLNLRQLLPVQYEIA